MGLPGLVALLVLVLMLAKWAVQLWLEHLNRRHVLAHANAVPDAFKNIMDEAAYAKSVQYTLAKSRLHQIETTYHLAVLAVVLFSGVLPWGFRWFSDRLGVSAWAL